MVATVTIDSKDGSTYVVTVVGSTADVGSEMASGTVANAATAGTQWNGNISSLMPHACGATNVCSVMYLAKKHH